MSQAIVIENKEQIKDRIAASGFGRRFDRTIDDSFASGIPKFKPDTSEMIEGRRMDFELDVNSKDTKGYYNGYKATLYNPDGSTVSQWFKASDRITMNEAHCLLVDQENPRAVLKTLFNDKGERYEAWLQINFNKKTESGNHEVDRFYDKEASPRLLEKFNEFAIVDMDTLKAKLDAVNKMKEGQEITLVPVNQEKYSQILMRANPSRKTVAIMDTDRNFLSHDQFKTVEARQRIQNEKNAKSAGVNSEKEAATTIPVDTTDLKNKDIPTSESIETSSEEVKKKNNKTEQSAGLKTNKKQRVVANKPSSKKGQAVGSGK